VTGNPSLSDVGGVHRVQITADDGYNKTLDILTINVEENDPPQKPVSFPTSFISYEDTADTTIFPPFNDDEGDSITYTMQYKNGSSLDSSWINFDPLTRSLSYTPYLGLPSLITLTLTTNDAFNSAIETDISMTIKFKPKDNPSIVDRTGEFVCLSFSSFEISKNILTDEDIITQYNIQLSDGSPVPSWLQILYPNETASGNFKFSGTYPTEDYTLYNFTIHAKDPDGMTGSASFYIQTKRKFFFFHF